MTKKTPSPNAESQAAQINNYRSLLANFPHYKMGYANLGIALFNKAADLQHKNKDWVVLDLLEEVVFWNPQDKNALKGLNAQIGWLDLNPKS